MSDQFEQRGSTAKAGRTYDRVLISISNPNTADQLIRLAHQLTGTSSVLHILNITTEQPFPDRVASWRRSSQLVMDMTHLATRLGRVAKPLAATASSIPGAILNAAKDAEADLIIMGWFGRITPLAVRKSKVVNKVLHRAACDTAVLKFRGDFQETARLLVPVGLTIHEGRMDIVHTLRQENATDVVLVHVLAHDSELNDEEVRDCLANQVRELENSVEICVVHAKNVVEGILGVAEEHDLIVIGPGREWVFSRFLFGRHADQITNRAPCSVLLHKSREMKMSAWLRGLIKMCWARIRGQ